MIRAADLVRLFRQALEEKWGYIWGASGQLWTQAKQDAATRDQTVKYGKKWIGHKVADCSGLFVWAFKQLGGSIYHGSNTMWRSYCTEKGEVTPGIELAPGTSLYKCRNGTDYYHTGLYVGDGIVIEARGTSSGVVTSKLQDWTHWGRLKGVSYDESEVEKMDVLYQAKVITKRDPLTLRAGNSTDAQKIGSIPRGEVVNVLKEFPTVRGDEWAFVEYNGTQGYVSLDYLLGIYDTEPAPPSDQDAPALPEGLIFEEESTILKNRRGQYMVIMGDWEVWHG